MTIITSPEDERFKPALEGGMIVPSLLDLSILYRDSLRASLEREAALRARVEEAEGQLCRAKGALRFISLFVEIYSGKSLDRDRGMKAIEDGLQGSSPCSHADKLGEAVEWAIANVPTFSDRTTIEEQEEWKAGLRQFTTRR